MRATTLSSLLLLVPAAALAKTDPAANAAAAQKAELNAAFTKLVTKWQDYKKELKEKKEAMSQGKCVSYAKDFADFGSKNKSAEGHFNAGVLFETCGGDTKAAKDAFHDALKANPQFAPAMVNLGEIEYRAGNIREASSQFE